MQSTLIEHIIRFCQENNSVSALILVGSQARSENPADAFSDTDLILIVKDPAPFVETDSWLNAIGSYHIAFTESTIDGQMERRVLFDNAQDVDFVIMQTDAALYALQAGDAAMILHRGYRVLVDKIRLPVPAPVTSSQESTANPTPAEFTNIVSDFWFHTVWVTKKLLRQELWTAKFCVDGYMKWKLLWIIEQHEHRVRQSGQDTWYGGRFLERWAAEDVLTDLQRCFAHFDRADMGKALIETMNLFRRLAEAVAQAAGYSYPAHADAYATEWVTAQLTPVLKEGDAP